MAYSTELSQAQSGLTGWMASLVTALRIRFEKRRVYRTTLNELSSLSTRELADLGLHRSMLRRVAWQAAYEA
ncbi:DUF1127 domain-containing protein [Pseudoprimorskyibacter insulae]|uniref:YjiS-like domain-containing protein n=1 Tax=Pseudoprimorskyibacter insulae TaxID=1695997 RepID=A0A2R8AQB5_9RHOB|nr:DUF1127 domain-containing protein [Pseudoprimorskyibacter insulae]SPF78288.1 hypothetical protein PRI8871_00884 [Pseudoprimorskyibacter insulae]